MPQIGKTVQPNSFSKLIPAACNFKNNAKETYLFVSDISFTCNCFAYFEFHSDRGRVIGKIKPQNEVDCRDTVCILPLWPTKTIQKYNYVLLSYCNVYLGTQTYSSVV